MYVHIQFTTAFSLVCVCIYIYMYVYIYMFLVKYLLGCYAIPKAAIV